MKQGLLMGKLRSSLRKIYGVTQWVALVEQELQSYFDFLYVYCVPSSMFSVTKYGN
jgi:hypothetical protein